MLIFAVKLLSLQTNINTILIFMKFKQTFLVGLLVSATLVSCSKHPSFKNPEEAVNGCHEVLSNLQGKKDVDNEELAKLTAEWLETQDSAYSVFGKDSAVTLRSPVALAYFMVSDSIRHEITRLAFSKPRSLNDVMYLKLNTATEREKVKDSDTYKDAVKFYESLDKQGTYSSVPMTLSAYYVLLKSAKPFKQERQLIAFIAEEDKCFRSLMNNLSKIPNADLQNLTNATTAIFDDLYSSVGKRTDDVNDRTMLYLTMRFNRRIIQNALACKNDILNNQRLDREQRANYKWMLIQPFMAIDDYSTAVLTDSQRDKLLKLSEDIPALLGKLDVQKKSDNEQIKLTSVLANYFLKSYLSTTL